MYAWRSGNMVPQGKGRDDLEGFGSMFFAPGLHGGWKRDICGVGLFGGGERCL